MADVKEWEGRLPTRGFKIICVQAETRKEAEEMMKNSEYIELDYEVTWSGKARIVGPGYIILKDEEVNKIGNVRNNDVRSNTG